MKYKNLNKWDNIASCTGLILFSQLLEEMLFDFSLDTYKASVMHTGLLCAEAIATIGEIESGNIKAPNIWHVNAELCANFEKDPVAQALIPLPPSAFFPALKNTKSPLKEVDTVLRLLQVHMSVEKYRNKTEELLSAEIQGHQSLAQIRRLTRSYITSLVAVGFDQRFIRAEASRFFCYGTNRIANANAIMDFFAVFPMEFLEFNVIFRVDEIFEHLSDALVSMGLVISRNLPAQINLSQYPNFKPANENKLFAIAEKVKARDVHSARSNAEYRLKLSSTLLNLFHHKVNATWRPECIVHDIEKDRYIQISSPINAMHKCSDLLDSVASKRLSLLMSEFSLEQASFSKFIRSAQLHSMALASNAYENQILNLWISLESLVPSETKLEDASNIEHIVNSLIPFLNIGYIERLLDDLVKNLLRWNRSATKAALRGIIGRKFTEKLARLMALSEHADALIKLESTFGNFYLLRDRFEYIKGLLSKPANVVAALDAHKIRLEWQIRRIYRTRNIIVHSGQTPSYTKSLIEHTHDYLDIVLSVLVRLASTPKSIQSVAQGFKYVELKYELNYKAISPKNLIFDSSNIEAILF